MVRAKYNQVDVKYTTQRSGKTKVDLNDHYNYGLINIYHDIRVELICFKHCAYTVPKA
jgi:hypothetical protein